MISVDTKKKELIGDFKTHVREWQPSGHPEPVRVHDFPGGAVGKAMPYGVYDMARNEAWVSVGREHDTPAFAVAAIRQWWTMMGRRGYPAATDLYITADAGGSNGYRSRPWKAGLQRLADELRFTIHRSAPLSRRLELRCTAQSSLITQFRSGPYQISADNEARRGVLAGVDATI